MKRTLLLFCLLSLALPPLSTVAVFAQQFGSVVAVQGDQTFVGDGRQPAIPGVVYVFEKGASSEWIEKTILDGGDHAEIGDGFGNAIAMNDGTLAIGAPGSAQVFLFSQNADGEWIADSRVEGNTERFGSVVAVSGGILLVTSPKNEEQEAQVLTYERLEDGVWESRGVLTNGRIETAAHAGEIEEEDNFGAAIALDGSFAAISAPANERGNGAVYAFSYDHESRSWSSGTRLATPFDASGASVGTVLWMKDKYLAVGAPGFSSRVGTVALYNYSSEAEQWSFEQRLAPFSSVRAERFGSSITSSGNEFWIGAPGYGGRRGSGATYRFVLSPDGGSEGNRVVTGSSLLPSPDVKSGGQLGTAIAANSGVAIFGAPGYDNRAGAAFAAHREGTDWVWSSPLVNESFGYESVSGEMVECKNDEAGDFPCKDVDMTSFVSMKDLGADRGIRTNDLWGWEDPETGREYAIVGLSNQTSFVDVTDPYNPMYLGELDMPETANISVWRDMKVYKDHVYIVSDGAGEHGIQIFDLRLLRNVTIPVTFEETAHYPGIFSAHNIVINEDTGYAYSVGSSAGGETCGGGLHMIDIREPAKPVFAGCFSDGESGRRGTGYSHDAQCVVYSGPDADYTGHEICIGSNETAISIADVTDKSNPVSVSMASYPSVSYAHQGWFTDDQRYFYLNDELDEAGDLVEGTRTLIWDLEDLDEPVLAGEHIAQTTETDHNLYVKGDLMYQSNTGAGLRILDISDPEKPFETAYFDTSPVGGRGVSWSNYPYFKSGIIVVTGGHYGLFLLKKKEVDI